MTHRIVSLLQPRWQIECRYAWRCLCISPPSRLPKGALATTSAAGIQRRLLDMPMTSSRLRCELILVVLAIVTVFFFPSSLGGYPLVHSLATVFQGARTAARAYASIVQAALVVVRITLVFPLVVLARLVLCPSDNESMFRPSNGV
jgi:hypothetical protein